MPHNATLAHLDGVMLMPIGVIYLVFGSCILEFLLTIVLDLVALI